MKTKPNEAAFPLKNELIGYGLTKREYFAAMALCGISADPSCSIDLCGFAVKMADQLIEELNKEQK